MWVLPHDYSRGLTAESIAEVRYDKGSNPQGMTVSGDDV